MPTKIVRTLLLDTRIRIYKCGKNIKTTKNTTRRGTRRMASALQIVQSESNDQIRLNNNARANYVKSRQYWFFIIYFPPLPPVVTSTLSVFIFFLFLSTPIFTRAFEIRCGGERERNKTRFIRYFSFNLTIWHLVNDVPLSTTINIDLDGNLTNSVIYLCYLPGQVGITKKK